MKKQTIIVISGILFSGCLSAQDVKPVSSSINQPLGGLNTVEISPSTRALLQEHERQHDAALEATLEIQSDAEAQTIIDSILANEKAATIISESKARARIRAEEAGRTEEARLESVKFLSRRLRGDATLAEAPESFRSRMVIEATANGIEQVRGARPRFYDDNYRVVTYPTMSQVPRVLVASSRFNRVKVEPITQSPYAETLAVVERRPSNYISPEAYAVTYAVDPNSEVTRDDILFEQGSTAFADAYSYDLVVDLATAMTDPALAGESFVVEGHASSEGDYHENLVLSQKRAERIVREMVLQGVSTSRLVPVGVGENEADYPPTAAEELRATNRRVVVFRLK